MRYTKSLENLIESFKLLPGIGEKNAERLAFSVLKFDDDQVDNFVLSLNNVHKKIHECKICNNLTEDDDNCLICNDETRDDTVICVVENAKNLIMFEKANIFNGKYHVLGGLISPLEGVNPEDIKIAQLLERVKNNNIKEIILALNPSLEGETTAIYISKLLEGLNIKVTKIAAGIPVGADMEYLDSITIQRALEGRTIVE